MVLFVPILSPQTLQKWGFQQARGKSQNGTFATKSAILGFPSKGGFTMCDTQKLCFAENTIFIVFSAKHSFADMKECNLKKKLNKTLPKIGGCLPKCKKVFFVVCFLFFGGFVFVACVFVLLFCKKDKKAIFLQFWRFFVYFVPQKPVFKC